ESGDDVFLCSKDTSSPLSDFLPSFIAQEASIARPGDSRNQLHCAVDDDAVDRDSNLTLSRSFSGKTGRDFDQDLIQPAQAPLSACVEHARRLPVDRHID